MNPALFDTVIGQEAAVKRLTAASQAPVHAYLFVGPPGTGKRAAAAAFAAALLCAEGGCGACDVCTRALHELHPDLVVVEREGAAIAIGNASDPEPGTVRHTIRLAHRSPMESTRKVLVLLDYHLMRDDVAPAMLKTIEEPPGSTVIVVVAEAVTPALVTIASRCVEVSFGPLSSERIAAALIAEGIPADEAAVAARASGGRIDRARLLAADPEAAARQERWREVPAKLDGTGATVARLADGLLASLDEVLVPLQARHAAQLGELDERMKAFGQKGGAKDLADRQKREVRRVRTDELRAGLTALAGEYRDRLAAGRDPSGCLVAIDRLGKANEVLVRNPNELLLLQSLLIDLDAVAQGTALVG
ncbi:MAG TPA: hypothetical protein VMY34_08425 [Acidimicrobiales bacterium]|nr:hypothetical protein [Acidimicrobiales bacterium]